MKIKKNDALLVAGGALASCVLGKILKSNTTRNACVKVVAKGLETKDNIEHSITKMKEEAEDLYAEAVNSKASVETFDINDEESEVM